MSQKSCLGMSTKLLARRGCLELLMRTVQGPRKIYEYISDRRSGKRRLEEQQGADCFFSNSLGDAKQLGHEKASLPSYVLTRHRAQTTRTPLACGTLTCCSLGLATVAQRMSSGV